MEERKCTHPGLCVPEVEDILREATYRMAGGQEVIDRIVATGSVANMDDDMSAPQIVAMDVLTALGVALLVGPEAAHDLLDALHNWKVKYRNAARTLGQQAAKSMGIEFPSDEQITGKVTVH